MSKRVYLDWNATTPLRPEAISAMTAAMACFGNPSSVHAEGRAARDHIERARTSLARHLGAVASAVVFTSGGTEANAIALAATLKSQRGAVPRVLVSAIEHPAVRQARGAGGTMPATFIPVGADGVVDLAALDDLLAQGPALVAVMLANNETGVIQPIAEIARRVHAAGSALHVDAVQVFGKIPVDIAALGADSLAVSAHKLGGPKGVGALVIGSDRLDLRPLFAGGGQEFGRRGGTENVIGITGFAAAAEAACADLAEAGGAIAALRDAFERAAKQHSGVTVFGEDAPRLPNTSLIAMPGLKSETAVIAFDLAGIAISAGSACSSGRVTASPVLAAMGALPALANGALRLSLGWTTTAAEIDAAVAVWRRLAEQRR